MPFLCIFADGNFRKRAFVSDTRLPLRLLDVAPFKPAMNWQMPGFALSQRRGVSLSISGSIGEVLFGEHLGLFSETHWLKRYLTSLKRAFDKRLIFHCYASSSWAADGIDEVVNIIATRRAGKV